MYLPGTFGISPSIPGKLFPPKLLRDIRLLIESARGRTAAAVNSEMVTLYWSIGERVRKDILSADRAAYGEQIVDALSRKLSEEYGRGLSRANLFHMIRFAETFPHRKIVHALSRQLSCGACADYSLSTLSSAGSGRGIKGRWNSTSVGSKSTNGNLGKSPHSV